MKYLGLEAEWRCGYNAPSFGRYGTGRAGLSLKTWQLAWTFFYFNGYGDYICQYSEWSEGWGAGLRFW